MRPAKLQDFEPAGSPPSLILTTSWDDGHPLDLRVAELLAAHGVRGTFYVPVRASADSLMKPADLRRLRNLGMEIGAHTVSHPDLTTAADPFPQLVDGKRHLEEVLGEEITSIAYPYGRFDSHVSRLAREAGYRVGRTTTAFVAGRTFDAFEMPTSFQFVPHSRAVHIRHALREWNLKGLATWCWRWRCVTDLRDLTRLAIADARRTHGLVHIWGHSWEIDSHDLWGLLKEVLRDIVQQPGVTSMTNTEAVNALGL